MADEIKDPTRAEVQIGGYLADVELRHTGEIRITISGVNISKRLFAVFVRKTQEMKFVRFEDAR